MIRRRRAIVLPVTPGILDAMAKVMISMPDELLARVDRTAAGRKTSRSAVIREFTEQAYRAQQDRINQIVDEIVANAEPHGGDVVRDLKEGRPN